MNKRKFMTLLGLSPLLALIKKPVAVPDEELIITTVGYFKVETDPYQQADQAVRRLAYRTWTPTEGFNTTWLNIDAPEWKPVKSDS